jgi:hypothetical protein
VNNAAGLGVIVVSAGALAALIRRVVRRFR